MPKFLRSSSLKVFPSQIWNDSNNTCNNKANDCYVSSLTHCGIVTAIWQHRSGLILAQVMACCLTAPSHYLNQCWFTILKVQWHSSEQFYKRHLCQKIAWNYLSKTFFRSTRGQWVNNHYEHYHCQLIEARTKWPIFYSWHFQMLFLKIIFNLIQISLGCSQTGGPIYAQ